MLNWIERIVCIKIDLSLNNLQRLICHKTQKNNQPLFGRILFLHFGMSGLLFAFFFVFFLGGVFFLLFFFFVVVFLLFFLFCFLLCFFFVFCCCCFFVVFLLFFCWFLVAFFVAFFSVGWPYSVIVSVSLLSPESFELLLQVALSHLSAVLFGSFHPNISSRVFPSLALLLVVAISLPVLLTWFPISDLYFYSSSLQAHRFLSQISFAPE